VFVDVLTQSIVGRKFKVVSSLISRGPGILSAIGFKNSYGSTPEKHNLLCESVSANEIRPPKMNQQASMRTLVLLSLIAALGCLLLRLAANCTESQND